MGVQISFKLVSSFSLYVFPWLELLDHMLVLALIFIFFEAFPYYIPKWLYQFTIPPTVYNGSFFFPMVGSDGRVCLQSRRPWFDPWVRKIPWRSKWQPTPVSLPGKSHGWRSLASYILWGRKESDMTEQLHLHFFLHTLADNCYLLSFWGSF